jgi:hypothetical protein
LHQEFVNNLQSYLGTHVESPWGETTTEESNGKGKGKDKAELDTTDQMADVKHLAVKAGFVMDSVITQKKSTDTRWPNSTFKVIGEIDAATALKLASFIIVPGDPKQKHIEVAYSDLLNHWKVIVGPKVSELQLQPSITDPVHNTSWAWQAHVGAACIALRQFHAEAVASGLDMSKLYFTKDPYMVFATATIEKYGLTFVPSTTKIDNKKSLKSFHMSCAANDDHDLYLNPMIMQPSEEKSVTPWLVPFWLLRSMASSKEKVNMKLLYKTFSIDKYTVTLPYFTNSKIVKAYQELIFDADDYTKVAPVERPAKKSKAK